MSVVSRLSLILLPWLLLSLNGCDNQQAQTTRKLEPIAIEHGDECHVCGMIIDRFPGPKAEAFIRHQAQPLKFCSTRDLFVWLLQPESEALVQAVFVDDMEQAAWEAPQVSDMVPAETAWYVVGSSREGAMGPTLASFAHKAAAEAFAEKYGGRVLAYEDVDMNTLDSMMELDDMAHTMH